MTTKLEQYAFAHTHAGLMVLCDLITDMVLKHNTVTYFASFFFKHLS